MKIFELETKNGRLFRVAVSNESQKARLFKKIAENKGKYEEFKTINCAINGIYGIKDFEKLADNLV